MSEPVIKVENLGKKYIIGHQKQEKYTTMREVITNTVKSILTPNSKSEEASEEFWALKDINFEIKQGDRVGIIGRNGAGKSTLLKVLSRITEPTKGQIEIRGRVASLLEVGTGFHPELTGRENIFLNGAILGMGKIEIKKKFDEIVAFAEVEKFLDTPVKRYSSGMYVRLAFAVAAHLEPEVLIVDEVLAVGDAQFQKKCLGKMQNVAEQGKTVLFVSHNMQAISTLTQNCLMLSKGRSVYFGSTETAIANYLSEGQTQGLVYNDVPSDTEPKITQVELVTSEPNNVQTNGESMKVVFEITTPRKIFGAAIAFHMMNSLGQPMVHLLTADEELSMCRQPGVFKLACYIPKLRLYLGKYHLKIHFSERQKKQKLQVIEEICPFEVVSYGKSREGYWIPGSCSYVEECSWHVKQLTLRH